ncbi:hypothetical protein niasHT_002511 [Heterodera trifolii]|uniref:non-specific serine/threonine protein kinase n=1 Tax=Heterodera trifolii TaxID=157864 RepID=A0ABD2M7X2_9BILA
MYTLAVPWASTWALLMHVSEDPCATTPKKGDLRAKDSDCEKNWLRRNEFVTERGWLNDKQRTKFDNWRDEGKMRRRNGNSTLPSFSTGERWRKKAQHSASLTESKGYEEVERKETERRKRETDGLKEVRTAEEEAKEEKQKMKVDEEAVQKQKRERESRMKKRKLDEEKAKAEQKETKRKLAEMKFNESDQVSWRINGQPLERLRDKRCSVVNYAYICQLKIVDVVPLDSTMKVQITLDDQTIESVLTVEETPVEFAEKLPRKTIAHCDETITLAATLSHDAVQKISWYHNGRELTELGTEHAISKEGCLCSLEIRKISYRMGGRYMLKVDRVESSTVLEVHGKPSLDQPKGERIVLDSNENLSLNIPLKSLPEPEVDLYLNGELLTPELRTSVTVLEGALLLTRKELTKEDRGTYRVVLFKEYGEAAVEYEVYVSDVPDPPSGLMVIDVGHDYCFLKWNPPPGTDLFDDSERITGYVVEKKGAQRRVWQRVGQLSQFTNETFVEELDYDHPYVFWVTLLPPLPSPQIALHHNGIPSLPLLPPPAQNGGATTDTSPLPDAQNGIVGFLPGGSSADMSRVHRMSSGRDLSRLAINLDQLRRFWTVQPLLSREDWLQWVGTLRNQFIRQSPSSALRACAVLAEMCESLSKELFNAAFMSVWTELPEREQNELTNQLIDVLRHCPHAEPIQTILNLAEFMDHSEKGPLPIKHRMLSESAEKTRAYAKALRYKEMEILSTRGNGEPNADDCQTMIMLFNKLNLEEGAAGIVQYAKRHNMEISGRWYEKLGEWEKALEMYQNDMTILPDEQLSEELDQSKPTTNAGLGDDAAVSASASTNRIATPQQQNGSSRSDLLLHQMRCLEALGQWSQLDRICETALAEEESNQYNYNFNIATEKQQPQRQLLRKRSSRRSGARLPQLHAPRQPTPLVDAVAAEFLNATLSEVAKRQKIATMGARGCWAVGNFKKMEHYVDKINENNRDGAFLRAVLAVHNNDFDKAYSCINKVRDMFDSELTAMAAESYERAYGAMVLLQELTELEEAIEYKMIPEREMRIALLWSRRLQGCRRNVEHWRRILMVRSIVFSQTELRPLWVKFAALCRHEGRQVTVSRNVIRSLLEVPPDTPLEKVPIPLPLEKTQLALALCKQLWVDSHRRTALVQLEQLTQTLHRCIERNRTMLTREQLEPHARLTAKCYLKLGEWHDSITAIQSPLVSTSTPPITSRHGSISLHSGVPSAALSTAQIEQQHKQPFTWSTAVQQQQLQSQQPTATFTPSPIGTYFTGMDQSGAKKLILQCYINATNFDPNWYKAWHRLATTYYNMIMADRQQRSIAISPANAVLAASANQSTAMGAEQLFTSANMPSLYTTAQGIAPPTMPPQQISPIQSPFKSHQLITVYALNAVRCFFKTIQLAEGSRLDDTLRLLMLWFDYGDRPEVFEQLRDSVKLIPLEVWLEVVPQLIGRLDSQQNIGLLVKQLVIDVAKVYPQAWVLALTAATKSRNTQRSQVAKEILDIVAETRPVLVEQAILVNDELIRCAILWHELWHEALDNASHLYFEDKNVEEMMNVLRPLHQKIEHGHTTLKEQSFNQAYYKDLKDAFEHCEAFRRSRNPKEIKIAWDLYYTVFKRIIGQLRQMSTLDLNYIAPRLCAAKNLELSVPGTYDPTAPLVTIASIHPHLQVITSKQRPRKIYIRGSDGKEYIFLLKGHEDPRQDERVMQLFGLVNSLILREAETSRRNLTIQRYSITTLSQSSGLIGWF